ncbi:hypothetical protein DPMN_040207 [Dreissena polymorpha]|uniref:Uncharacterized protein n=1 Tax=Dreissena polymorpha TaxID=45954 RepID=A0A9D4CXP4_DREPO|nr:hypothetical protein DPMN_040207 [Dreissena polymorpha]
MILNIQVFSSFSTVERARRGRSPHPRRTARHAGRNDVTRINVVQLAQVVTASSGSRSFRSSHPSSSSRSSPAYSASRSPSDSKSPAASRSSPASSASRSSSSESTSSWSATSGSSSDYFPFEIYSLSDSDVEVPQPVPLVAVPPPLVAVPPPSAQRARRESVTEARSSPSTWLTPMKMCSWPYPEKNKSHSG